MPATFRKNALRSFTAERHVVLELVLEQGAWGGAKALAVAVRTAARRRILFILELEIKRLVGIGLVVTIRSWLK